MAERSEGSGGGLFGKAKDAVSKLASEENIDKAAEQAKKVAPESADRHIDKAAEEAKKRTE